MTEKFDVFLWKINEKLELICSGVLIQGLSCLKLSFKCKLQCSLRVLIEIVNIWEDSFWHFL